MAGTRKAGSSGSRTVIDSSGLFSKGLNTELHEIEDAAIYSSDECNCVIRTNGSRSRRLGVDYEEGYQFALDSFIDGDISFAYSVTEWTDVYEGKSKPYIVVQAGDKIYFYEKSKAPFSAHIDPFVIDLLADGMRIKGRSDSEVAQATCKFTEAYGGLFICSKAVKPFFVNGLEKVVTSESKNYSPAVFTNILLGPYGTADARTYDPHVILSIDGEAHLESIISGYYLGLGWSRRWVVLDSEGNKVGRMTIKRGSKESDYQNIPVYAYDSNNIVARKSFTKIEVLASVDLTEYQGLRVSSFQVKKDNGELLGTAVIADDFFIPLGEGESSLAWGSKNKVMHQPTAQYYADLWNDAVMPGETKTAREKTKLKAVAITPYSGRWGFASAAEKIVEITDSSDKVIQRYSAKVDSTKPVPFQKEWLVFVSEEGYEGKSSIYKEFWFWGDKISHRDPYKTTQRSYFNAFYVYSKKQGLNIEIRDFKGTYDKYLPDGAPEEEAVDLREGSNISIRPLGEELSDAHRYNLINQGWYQRVAKGDETDLAYNVFKEACGSWPANNMYWFAAKDEATQKFVQGSEWKGNNFLEFRPKDLLQFAFGDTPAPRGHYVLNYFEQDRSAVSNIPGLPVEYPRYDYVTDIATYAGRVFYLTGDTVLYSQVVLEDLSKAGKCYQEADPTCEEISDLVDTDGGMLQIPEIGEGIKLVHVGGVLAVIGTRSTYLICPGSENNFTATAYVGSALQTYTSESPMSFVEAEGSVFYWSTVGVVQLVPSQAGLTSEVISKETIQTFYDNISDIAKKNCKGFFDNVSKEIWWMYPGDDDKPRVLNKALVLNVKTATWTRFEFVFEDSETPAIVSAVSLTEPFNISGIYPLYAEEKRQEQDTIQPLYTAAEAKIVFTKEIEGSTILKKGNVWATGVEGDDFLTRSDGSKMMYTNQNAATAEYPFDGRLESTEIAGQVLTAYRIHHGKLEHKNAKLPAEIWTELGEVVLSTPHAMLKADESIETDRKKHQSSLFVCLNAERSNITFGLLNNLNYKDWASEDWKSSGYDYDSYLVSHPITLDMPYYNKTIPYLLATFRRTEKGFDVTGRPIHPSACQGAILWDWNTNGDSGKWDAQQELYRYDKATLLDSKYITSKTRVYGSGRAFQVKLSAVDNRAFDVENVGFQMYIDGRI